MQEFSVPGLAEPTRGGLAEMVFRNAAEEPQKTVFSRKVFGQWGDVTAERFRDEVVALAKGLVASGIASGDRVALMSATRYEWTLFDYALWTVGAIPIPVYATSSAEQVRWILSDSGATACIVENAEQEATVDAARSSVPGVRQVWRIDAGCVGSLNGAGNGVGGAELDRRRAGVSPEQPATIIYTSGTTGRPKGCVLSHANLQTQVDNAVALLHPLFRASQPGVEPATLLFLPLAHVFGRMVQVACVRSRTRMGHAAEDPDLAELASFRPTFILAVPQMLEKVYNRAAHQAASSHNHGRLFAAATTTAIAYSKALDSEGPAPLLRIRHALFDRLVYRKLRTALGGQIRYAVSGGAPLGERLGHFYRGIGVTICEGYGLTETSGAATVNAPTRSRIGTVGQPLPGTTVRIAEDGEVLIKGGQVFHGYWSDRESTDAVLSQDGWLATGDLGDLDRNGYLTITGRKKEVIVTASGKNVTPTVIEDRVRAHPLVSQCLVVGDNRPYVAALVTVDQEGFEIWKRRNGKPAEAEIADLIEDRDLIAAVQEAVDTGNLAVSRAEAVRAFRILPADFTVEAGYLTPSLKLRRATVAEDFKDEIDALYAEYALKAGRYSHQLWDVASG